MSRSPKLRFPIILHVNEPGAPANGLCGFGEGYFVWKVRRTSEIVALEPKTFTGQEILDLASSDFEDLGVVDTVVTVDEFKRDGDTVSFRICVKCEIDFFGRRILIFDVCSRFTMRVNECLTLISINEKYGFVRVHGSINLCIEGHEVCIVGEIEASAFGYRTKRYRLRKCYPL